MAPRQLCRLALTAAGASAAGAISGSDVAAADGFPSWHPGRGTFCYGVWTKMWAQEQGSMPLNLTQRLNETAPLVLEHIRRHECPYGSHLPGSVTWPFPPENLRGSVAAPDALKVIAVVYAYVPYAVGFTVFCSFVIHRGTRQIWVLMWLAQLVVVNELIIKKLIQEPRPGSMMQIRNYEGKYSGSCVASCGMPSSHSALAMGWFVLLFLDASFRVHPEAELLVSEANQDVINHGFAAASWMDRRETFSRFANTLNVRGLFQVEVKKICDFLRVFVLVPWVPKDALTHMEFVSYVTFWFMIMVPVPFMRVALYDHSIGQVCVGAISGAIHAVVWWRVVRIFQRRYEHLVGQKVLCGLLKHDYPLPRFRLTRQGREWGIEGVEADEIYKSRTMSRSHVDRDHHSCVEVPRPEQHAPLQLAEICKSHSAPALPSS